MNQYSIASSVTLSRAELTEIGDKMQENKLLKNTVETLNSTITTLNNENKDLKKQIKKLNEENKSREQDMKKKFMDLHLEQKKVTSELGKYEAIPEFKGILDLYAKLLEFRKKIDNAFENDPIAEEKRKLDKKIEDYKQKNLQLETILKQKGARITARDNTYELRQAEVELNKHKKLSQAKYTANKLKVNQITANMKSSTTKLVETITNALKEVQKHLAAYEADLKNMKKSNEEFVEKPTYDKIMNILLEQQNALMKDMLLGGITVTPTGKNADNVEFQSDSDSDSPDEDDAESVYEGNKRYKIIMHNINEEILDGLKDIDKVRAIMRTFTTLSTEDIDVERMGKFNAGSKRPIKVLLPTFQHVQVLLKSKHKLQNTIYADVRIASFQKRTPGPKPNFQHKGHKKRL